MPINDFSITGLVERAFGSRGKPFDVSKVNDRNLGLTGNDFDTSQQNEPVIRNDMEFPELLLTGQEGRTFVSVRNALGSNLPDGRELFMPCKIGDVLLPNEPTISIRGKKKIVKTTLTGSRRKGTVKELINVEDYSLVIRGVAITYDNYSVYPEDEVRQLNGLYLRNESLPIRCALTQLLGIYRVVIDDINFPPMVGVQHAQAYEILCTSDEDFILEIE